MTTTTEARHRVRCYADERGHVGSCACGWRVVHVNAGLVRDAAARHLRDAEMSGS